MTFHRILVLFCVTVFCPRFLFSQAVIEGRVELPKTHGAPVVNQRYEVVAKSGVLSTYPPLAVVYLEGTFAKPAALTDRQMGQKDLMFNPSLLPVRLGTKVEFPNFDDTYHDVFSLSRAKRFDLGRYRPDTKPVPSVVFDMAGLVTVRCDIHEYMRALILVLDTPHFVVTDEKGNFRLAGLPSGHYTLKAWVDSRTTLEHPVEVPGTGTLQVNFP